MRSTVVALAALPSPDMGRSSGGILAHAAARLTAWLQARVSTVSNH
jgi:hypothetical protein